jgi:hypothetical protein
MAVVTAVTAAASLAACAPANVKDVVADKNAYMEKHFAMTTARQAVVATISPADTTPLPFQKMTFTVVVEPEYGNKDASRPAIGGIMTYVNVGGPYVQRLVEESSNQLPILQTYMLSYRGLMSVRWQDVHLNSPMANQLLEMKSIKPIPAWPTGTLKSDLDYEYQYGLEMQIANFYKAHVHCQPGEVFPASRIHSKLVGEAQMLDCQQVNSNGVVNKRTKEAYLSHYGIVFMTHIDNVNSATTIRVTDVQVQ